MIVIAVAAYVVISNAKRGVTKVLVLCCGYIAATLLSSILSGAAAPLLYESVAKDSSLSTLETVNERVSLPAVFAGAIDNEHYGFTSDQKHIGQILSGEHRSEFDVRLFEYVTAQIGTEPCSQESFTNMLNRAFVAGYSAQLEDRAPRYVSMMFRRSAADDPQIMRDFVTLCGDKHASQEDCAAFMEERYNQEPAQETLRIFIYLIIFSIIMVFAAIISSALQNSIFINVTEASEHTGGALLGLLEACAMIVLITLVVRLIVLLTGDQTSWCNERVIGSTAVFSHIYNQLSLML